MFKKKKKKKEIERICKNCRLYNPKQGLCRVIILHEGQKINLPMEENDPCFFEQEYFDPNTGEKSDYNYIEEVKLWAEDPNTGKKSDKGIIKIEYPKGFFGKET